MWTCEQCFSWTNVTPFCDACNHTLAPAAVQLGENEFARRDRLGQDQPQTYVESVAQGPSVPT
jgi:hypothetical protein